MKKTDDIPVFAICLEREAARKERLAQHLQSLNMPFQFSNAVDGRKLSADERDHYYSEKQAITVRGRPLADGEIGCYLSHSRIWERMVDQQIELALVLESDAVLTDETTTALKACQETKTHWDLIMLFYRECYPSLWHRSPLTEQSRLVRFSNKSACTTAYLITLEGARKLLKKAYPIHMPVDDFMTGGYIKKGINTFAVYPRCVHLTEDALDTSTIREDLFPMMAKSGIKRRQPDEKKWHKEIEKNIRRSIKKILPPPWL